MFKRNTDRRRSRGLFFLLHAVSIKFSIKVTPDEFFAKKKSTSQVRKDSSMKRMSGKQQRWIKIETYRACKRTRAILTHLTLDMEGSVPNSEGDAMQQRLRFLPQRRFNVRQVIVRGVLPGVAAAAAIRPQPSARQRAAVRARHRCWIRGNFYATLNFHISSIRQMAPPNQPNSSLRQQQ